MEFEVGKTYEISHTRKGRLTVKVTAINGEWVDSLIQQGVVKRMSGAGEGPGEELTFRASFATILKEVV